jgi:hypothetical protein
LIGTVLAISKHNQDNVIVEWDDPFVSNPKINKNDLVKVE